MIFEINITRFSWILLKYCLSKAYGNIILTNLSMDYGVARIL